MTQPDRNWRKEMESFTTDEAELKVLREGPKSLAQSWHLQALHSKWKKIMGLQDPPPKNTPGSFQDLEKRITELESEISTLKAQNRGKDHT